MTSDDSASNDGAPRLTQEMASLGQYALAMQAAQFLEYKLAILYVLVQPLPRRATPPKDLAKAMRPMMRRVAHAFQRASASDLRKRLEDHLDEDLLAELSALIDIRDRLAHRYLREQYVLEPPRFGARMYAELEEIAQRFDAMQERLDRETGRVSAAKFKDDDSGEVDESVALLAQSLMYGDLLPDDAVRADPRRH